MMNDKLREAAKAALKLLDDDDRDCAFAANILRAALAEPDVQESLTGAEQEPMLEMNPQKREWVGLTDDEAQKTFAEHNCDISTHLAGILARAIEAKLKEKNGG